MERLCKQIELLQKCKKFEETLGFDTSDIDLNLEWFYSQVDKLLRKYKINK